MYNYIYSVKKNITNSTNKYSVAVKMCKIENSRSLSKTIIYLI